MKRWIEDHYMVTTFFIAVVEVLAVLYIAYRASL
jgi:hypothetical protein